MPASPALRRMRTVLADAHGDAEFTARLIDAIENDPIVQASLLHLLRRSPASMRASAARERSR